MAILWRSSVRKGGENLHNLFGLTPLEQQHICNSEICALLVVDRDRGLVVLELKNTEDRYLVQQLTRRDANLLEEGPFLGKVDYTRPIQLIGIALIYHRRNLIDRAYSRLT